MSNEVVVPERPQGVCAECFDTKMLIHPKSEVAAVWCGHNEAGTFCVPGANRWRSTEPIELAAFYDGLDQGRDFMAMLVTLAGKGVTIN